MPFLFNVLIFLQFVLCWHLKLTSTLCSLLLQASLNLLMKCGSFDLAATRTLTHGQRFNTSVGKSKSKFLELSIWEKKGLHMKGRVGNTKFRSIMFISFTAFLLFSVIWMPCTNYYISIGKKWKSNFRSFMCHFIHCIS